MTLTRVQNNTLAGGEESLASKHIMYIYKTSGAKKNLRAFTCEPITCSGIIETSSIVLDVPLHNRWNSVEHKT